MGVEFEARFEENVQKEMLLTVYKYKGSNQGRNAISYYVVLEIAEALQCGKKTSYGCLQSI